MHVPFLDLRVTDNAEREALLQACDQVFRHGRLVLGPELEELEASVAARQGRKYAVGVNSGTDALVLTMRALGYGPGDEIITTPLSFIATANAIALCGATPVFADIGDDLVLDPQSIEPLIGPRTRAIIPVHWAGRVCDMDRIMQIAERHGLTVIEDCSQAFGASRKGRPVGSHGLVACYSMNPMKVFAALGEAGMVLTDSAELNDKFQSLRYNGLVNREFCRYVSHNGRLDTLQAAMLQVRLKFFPQLLARRSAISAAYDAGLRDVVTVPPANPECQDVIYTYTIQADKRDELRSFLESKGIETKVQHLPLMPEQEVYQTRGIHGGFPNARRLMKRTLCIPAHEKMTDEQVAYVIESIRTFYGR